MTEALVARLTAALTGRYGIERELGQGGMATVYLARDLRHDRRVALKVLRPELAAVIGADRFLQEIRVTAGLQHPHILPLHDSGEIDHFLYYVMPYVEGESLRDRLVRERQLSIEDALRIAGEVAAALAYAHGRGVIHRDIKPENILLGASGAAVVADFGIARAVTAAGGGRLTETGLSLGTPQYMSPEQATADRELDGRSDVYALGAVLYEMLTGEPPHTGPTTQSVIAKLLTEEPRPVLAGRPTVPPHVAAAVHKSLARLPADRFRGAADFAEALARPGTLATAPGHVLRGPGRGWRSPYLLGTAGVLLVAVAVALSSLLRTAPDAPAPVVRSLIGLPPHARMSTFQLGVPLALSPDGTTLVYGGSQQLYVRRLDQLEAVPLPNTQGGNQPFFSPDGRQVGFLAQGSLKRVALAGGPVATICPAQGLSGASWGPDDRILFSAGNKLFQVAASGGAVRPIVVSDSVQRTYRWPDVLPDGRRALVMMGLAPALEMAIVELETGRLTPIAEAGANPRFVEPGLLLFFSDDGTGMVMPFDWRRGRKTGPTRPVLEGVTVGIQGVAKLAHSRNGTLVYHSASANRRRLVLVDRRGTTSLLPTEARAFSDPRFSPSGHEVAVTAITPGGGLAGDIWVLTIGAQLTLSRLTFDGRQQFPDWSADGRHVLFTGMWGSRGLSRAPAGGGPRELLLERPGEEIFEGTLTRDEKIILYRVGGIPADLYYVRRDSLGAPHPLLTSPFDERSPVLSPDDRWLAYVSNETGRDEVYVRPFPQSGGRWLVSSAGGTEARWRRDSQELFYRNGDSLFAVQVRTSPSFSVGVRTLLFTGDYLANPRHATYDVHPDGRRFLFITGDPQDVGELILVQNLVASAARAGGRDRSP